MPRRYIYADDDKDDEQLIWDALGRGSAAGRHLYNLYNGNTDGKRFGNMQSAYNGEVESRKTAEERRLPMEVEDAIKRDEAFLRSSTLKRWQVNVPGRFTGSRKPTEDEELRIKFDAQRRTGQARKPEATIRREMRSDPDFNGTARAPKPSKPLLGEAEKHRLQRAEGVQRAAARGCPPAEALGEVNEAGGAAEKKPKGTDGGDVPGCRGRD